MTDRIDIDALLIGALYGELTPADEARLTAHLESHPADRTALADLTRTRAQIHESRVLAFRAEPPQAVSALLLQEAARRAPRPQRESEGWFQRLARSLMAHPALATAATLVVVVGVAGTLYMRHGDKLAETSAREVVSETAMTGAAADTPVAQAPAAAPTTTPEPPPPAAVASAGPRGEGGAAGGTAAGSGAYGVGLSETSLEQRGAERARPADKAIAKPAPAKEAKAQKKASGIEVVSPEPSPKELEKSKRAATKADTADRRAYEPPPQADDLAQAPSLPAASPPPPPPPKAESAPQKPNVPGSGNAGQRFDNNKLSNNVSAGKGAPNAGSPSPSPSSRLSGNAAQRQQTDPLITDEQDADAKDKGGDTAWARNKHEQVIALVKSSNCRAAANAAMEIYGRAPGYYANNVATDRSVKPCLAYLNSEREKQRMRASKRANSANTIDAAPSQAAPEQQQQATPPVKK